MNKNTAYLWNSNYLFQFYLFFGAFFPFYPLWLSSFGIDSKDVGIILSCGLVSRCLSSIFVGTIIKSQSRYLPALKILSFLCVCTSLLMYFFNSNFLSLILICCLLNLSVAPIFGVSESIISLLDKRKILDYSRTRLWGSLGFVSATILCGLIFEAYSLLVLPVVLIILSIVMVSSLFIPCSTLDAQLIHTAANADIESSKVTPPTRLQIYLFFAIVILIQGSHTFSFGFASVYWAHLNISKTVIGYAWAFAVLGEVIVFLLARRLFAQTSALHLLVLSSLIAILRWSGLAYTETPALIFAIQLLHGGTFALAQIAMIKGIQLFISDAQLSTFQGLMQGLNTAVIALLTYFCGLYYDEYLGSLFLSMALIGFISLLLCYCFYFLFGSVSKPRNRRIKRIN